MQIAAEVAAPLSQAKKITMVSDGTGEIGAARVTGEVTFARDPARCCEKIVAKQMCVRVCSS